MFVYWSMFAFPALFALVTGPRSHVRNTLNTVGLFLVFILFAVCIGLRYEVGADWFTYELIVQQTSMEDFGTALGFGDPGFSLVAWLSAQVGAGTYGSNVVCGTLLVYGLFVFCKRQDDIWLAIAAAVPYLLVVVGMGYVRQAAAIGLILVALDRFDRGLFARTTGWLFAAALFHASAVLIAPLIGLAIVRKRVSLVVPMGIVTAILFVFLLQDKVDSFYDRYVEAEYDSSGAMIRLLMNAVPALLFLVYRKRFPGSDWSRVLWTLLSVLSLAMVLIVAISPATTLIDRIGLYFIPIQIYVFGNLAAAMWLERRGQVAVTALTLAYYSAILFVWLNYATHAESWVPYRFLPLES